jgi:hypothetical protein
MSYYAAAAQERTMKVQEVMLQGFKAGLSPRSSFFISIFPLDVACPAKSSSHQQDLPDATLFRRCLSLGRFTEWQFLANRDY